MTTLAALIVTELSRSAMLGIGSLVIVSAILAVAYFSLRAAAEKPAGVAAAEEKFRQSLHS